MRLLPCLAALGVACGGPATISVTATPSPMPGDGETPATIVASVTDNGSPADGVPVHFITTAGTFKDAEEGTPQILDVMATSGRAEATLIPPRQGWGKLSITASASVSGQQPKAAVDVPLAPAGGLAATLSFSCLHQNVGALVHGRLQTIHVLCTAAARDGQNKIIPKASVQTLTEAGYLDWAISDSGGQEFVYSVPPDAPLPKDVDPFDSTGNEQESCPAGCTGTLGAGYDSNACPGEPCWTDQQGNIHNPRDGVVTLVAAAPATKSIDNQGEPYVDSNDNGTHDPGEAYIDYNGNGKWDDADGKLKDRLVWRVFRIVWSGELDRDAGQAHAAFIRYPSKGNATVYLHDRNYNALAATGPSGGDGVDIAPGSCSGDGSLTTSPDPGFALEQHNPGILFANDGSISVPGLHSTYLQRTDYSFTGSLQGGVAGEKCGFTLTPHRSCDPGAPGYDATDVCEIGEPVGGEFTF